MNSIPTLPQRKAASRAVSAALLLMGASLGTAHAQDKPAESVPVQNAPAQNVPQAAQAAAKPAPAAPTAAQREAAADGVTRVLVVGAREAEQGSIARKKNAPTAQDSILAEDIGSFPDRNVAEAISRIAGVSLNRDEFGEGYSVSVRGNSNDLTRVELDGMGVTSAAGNGPNSNDPGRGTMLNDLPADLIASVDVVKGSTADMTEGSLGGGIIIKTRTGLDFKKRTIVVRTSASNSSLNNKWRPDLNLIFADKYLDGRLGVVANLSSSKYSSENHQYTAFNSTGSPKHTYDFDNSPEKTFSFQPNSVLPASLGPDGDTPRATYATTGGGPAFATLSPREIITRAAGANSKQDCYTAFPWHTAAQLNAISSANNRATAQSIRGNELQTCLSQWNDNLPWGVRRRIVLNESKRMAGDIRFDFKVNKDLQVYAKFNRATNDNKDNAGLFSQGGDISGGLIDVNFRDVVSTIPGAPGRTTTRTPIAGTGFYLNPYTVANKGTSGSTYNGLTNGAIMNVDPASVKVDDKHNVVGYRLSNPGYGIDTIQTFQNTKTNTFVTGGTYRNGGFRAEILAGRSESEYYRYAYRTNLYATGGPADVTVTPDGIVQVTPQSPIDLMNAANFSVLAAPSTAAATLGQARNTNTNITLDNNIKLNETSETTLKGDFTYALGDRVPLLSRVKFGFNARKQDASAWGPGYSLVDSGGPGRPAISVPSVRVTVPFTICENTPASLAPGGVPCAYGLSAPSGRAVTPTVTKAEFESIVSQSIQPSSVKFFDGMKDAPAGLGTAWPTVDLQRLFELSKVPNLNPLDCIKRCTGTDGKVYDQPFNRSSEQVSAGYLSTDFTLDRLPFTSMSLPFGMEIEGNFGYRYVRTKVNGTTSTTFAVVTPLDAANPDPDGAVLTTTVRRASDYERKTTDILPVLNLAWWIAPDEVVVRYNRAKTVARQPVNRIFGANPVCTYDFRRFDAAPAEDDEGNVDMSCSGVMGNPGLKPYTNINHNLSLEWYPNRDTMLTVSGFRQVGKIGAAQRITTRNARPFEGTGETDPSGRPLSDIEFTYSSFINGPAVTRTGFEVGGKTAFTFLPSVLRFTGASANFTKVRASSSSPNEIDFYTGEELPQRGVQRYSWNASLWYDDGALSMRASLQVVPATYNYMASNSAMLNYPNLSNVNVANAPYDMSMPIWNDARRFLDVKVGYKFKNGIELFAEARNLGKIGTSQYTPGSALVNGQPMLNVLNYGGARYLVGAVYRY